MTNSFLDLLNSPQRNRKKKRQFPDFWIKRGYMQHRAYELAEKHFHQTVSQEEHRMIGLVSQWDKDYWTFRGYSLEYAKEKVRSIQSSNGKKVAEKYNLSENKDDFYKYQSTRIEYWLVKTNGNIEEAKRLLAERQSTFSKEKCVAKFGEEEGLKVWQERQDRWQASIVTNHTPEQLVAMNASKAITLDNMKQKYGDAVGEQRYLEWKGNFADRNSLDWYIKLNGEEYGTRLYKESMSRKKLVRGKTAYLEKYGNPENIPIDHVKEDYFALTLEGYQIKYGVEIGTTKFKEIRKIWSDNCSGINRPNTFYSKESIRWFESFIPTEIMAVSFHSENEYYLRAPSNLYFYDFKYKGVIIEYHGETFHPNPNVLTEEELDEWCNPFNKTMDSAFMLNKDAIKRATAIAAGFKYFEIYSNDSGETKETIKKNILEALNEENHNQTI